MKRKRKPVKLDGPRRAAEHRPRAARREKNYLTRFINEEQE